MRILFVNHTGQKSGAGISLATLLRNLPGGFERFFLLPKISAIDAMLGADEDRTFHERHLCQFMTTLYVSQLSPLHFLWQLVKIPLAFARVCWLVRR